jgi:hypothetical protein
MPQVFVGAAQVFRLLEDDALQLARALLECA